MNLYEIANFLNKFSSNYKVGNLQKIRKELKGLERLPSCIFDYRTIKNTYAFHLGGRKEFQFNIGFEKKLKLFRYGMAFSLEKSRTLPDIEVLFPKIDRFNLYLKSNPSKFPEMLMWNDDIKNGHSKHSSVHSISNEFKCDQKFIFIGKFFNKETHEITNEDCRSILETFDELLDLYIFVENEDEKKNLEDFSGKFIFKSGKNDYQKKYFVNQIAQSRIVDATHKIIQENIYEGLAKKYGKSNIGTENSSGYGTSIDLVVNENGKYVFYEIKTNSSIRKCIREGLPQLLEYSYWPNRNLASKLVIVSENKITDDAKKYLNKLRKDFFIPIYYQRYDFLKKDLESNIY
ncbi:MAG: hypothetical protein COZ80_03825 [Ignavibacteria bacterium CG_4_8_14_3_um_filter_37_9]|nr:MAG: hypothetical protein COW85_13540 [Ignavibacteria bacterium CG22_combo_CG10-13_8_21_14_all_37_15]PIS44491.1 MAG: hypothetical protein COT22_10140 [Ignavibacteria bacterium CG08_land_8_20_14_0_20_37_9]PIW99747.1 MAG: hypothetical protein COZ80_03825 [Ignavibacteria bacterium CG_4_8_14_3_um_filter_37_9]PJC58734.1 MAG: hypothetical protein CO025_08430 [Ignavibacteria bacterium CG_4_9_14_0_2_um_filter_37_13]